MILRLLKSVMRWVRNFIRDIRFLSGMVPALLQIKKIAAKHTEPGSWSITTWWDEVVAKHAERTAIIYNNRRYTYLDLDERSNQYARMAMDSGVKPGDVVALSYENSPEFLFWFLGLIKIAAPVALLNINVEGSGLAQCLKSCKAEWLIHSEETRRQVETLNNLDESERPRVNFLCISGASETISSARIPAGLRKSIGYTDTALHIFTSGTTGLPKAAKISHLRYFGSSLIFSHLIGFTSKDVLYCPLPLYHSSAIVLGLGLCFHNGMPFVFQKKFSVRSFWSTCVENDVTVVQYIGELCRYLTAAKSTEEERQHCVRLALGNGLDRNVWETFQNRFNIPRIVEFYAATEANVGLVNTTGKVGAIGTLSPLLKKKHPGKLIRFDFETGKPIRSNNGFCIECKPNEVGEFVGMIKVNDPTQKFDGYSDEADTAKKLLHNILQTGDKAYRSGDLMTQDEDGYIYFVDRIGDTIRWKGENVSTTEVEAVIQSCENVKECSVYGVHVDGYEGKAGMALVKVHTNKDLPIGAITYALLKFLPEYARPVFLRFTEAGIETTVTFKYRKQLFANQGFDPSNTSGVGKEVYVRVKANNKQFVKLTNESYRGILDGTIRL